MNIRDTHPLGEVPGERIVSQRLAARAGISQPEAEQVAGTVLAALEEYLDPLETESLENELPVPHASGHSPGGEGTEPRGA